MVPLELPDEDVQWVAQASPGWTGPSEKMLHPYLCLGQFNSIGSQWTVDYYTPPLFEVSG